jgi:TP901 family phage tail tape measure protein
LFTSIVIGAALAGNFRATIGSAVAGIGEMKSSAGQLGQALAEVGAAWGALRIIGGATSLASDFSHELKQAGVTADLTNEQIGSLRQQLRGLAVPEQTNQSMQELLKGYTALVSAGMSDERARAMLAGLGRTATAAGANIEDLSKTAFVLNDTLGVAPEDMGKALDKLAFAGKQGAFELKDMARHFPTLGASAKKLGLQGSEAVATLGAALQIAKKGAGDPAEAANNMKNFLAKATAPETVKKFEEHGVNLKRVLKDAMAKGENPMEVLITKIQSMTKGDPFKIGELFGDMQVMDFLTPMLANMAQYKKLKGDIAASTGTVDTDFARMMEENKELAKGFRSEVTKLGEAVGLALLPPLNMAYQVLTPIVGALGNLADTAPTTTLAMVGVVTAFVVLPPAIRLATIAFGVFGRTLMANPIGLVIGGIALAAGLIIDNWGRVKSFFGSIWNGVLEHWRTILAFTGPLGWMAIKIIDNWTAIRDTAMAVWGGITGAWRGLVDAVAPVGEAIAAVFESAWSTIAGLWDAGVARIMALWEKVRGPLSDFARMMGWIAPEGSAAAVPKPGAAVVEAGAAAAKAPANDNQAPSQANDNVAPGSAVAAAQQRGQAVVAGGGGAPGTSAAPIAGRVDVVVRLEGAPAGTRVEARSNSPAVRVEAFTGQTMAGVN